MFAGRLIRGLVCCGVTVAGLTPVATRAMESGYADPPRLIRYASEAKAYRGQQCFGLVLDDRDGIPTRILNLGDVRPGLCTEDQNESVDAIRSAFDTIERIVQSTPARFTSIGPVETVDRNQLSTRILAPVVISAANLDAGRRFVVAAGLNYAEHRGEVGRSDAPLLLFPKAVVPTGAYSPVLTGLKIGQPAGRPVRLLDYELEIGVVLLRELDLGSPPDYQSFVSEVAFFAANDVTNREPIIVDPDFGYTRGKSHPTYLPIGPWMVHGRRLRLKSRTAGAHDLALRLTVTEPATDAQPERVVIAQSDQSTSMLRGPWEIVRELARRYQAGDTLCMRDAHGVKRYLHDRQGKLPAGSIMLTGTPGGTALREPGVIQKLGLIIRARLDTAAARRLFIEDTETSIADTFYLGPGDVVRGQVEKLGAQQWEVIDTQATDVYGADTPGNCDQPAIDG